MKLGKRTLDETKTIEIVAGPNGSGKTTFAESYLLQTRGNLVFLNPDIIASGIAPLDFEKASFQAGRVLISEIRKRINLSESFAFESTLSGRTWIYFLFLDSVRGNLQRIKKRVSMGGHHIPTNTVRRRQPRCFENFWNLYRPQADEWYIFNNSAKWPVLVQSSLTFGNLSPSDQAQFASDFVEGKFYGR